MIESLVKETENLAGQIYASSTEVDNLIALASQTLTEVSGRVDYQSQSETSPPLPTSRVRSEYAASEMSRLLRENDELKSTIQMYRNALDVIMSKYRQHVTALLQSRDRVAYDSLAVGVNSLALAEKNGKIEEMAAIMQKSIEIDDKHAADDAERTARLASENQVLRQLLYCSDAKLLATSSSNRNVCTQTESNV